jgi:hypothetical protein
MILRVFWPDNSCGLVQQFDQANSPCLLLGAILNSTQQAQAVTSAVVVAVIPFGLSDPLLEVQQQLSHTQVALSAQPGTAVQAALAVLGVWLPQKQHQQHNFTDDATTAAAAAAASAHGLWLALRDHQRLYHTLGCSWRAQQTTAPSFELQQCVLPPNTQSIQVTLAMHCLEVFTQVLLHAWGPCLFLVPAAAHAGHLVTVWLPRTDDARSLPARCGCVFACS